MTDTPDMPAVLFFCRDCQKIVEEPKKKGAKYEYSCTTCNGDNVAFGTREAICDFFHIKKL